MDTPPTIPILPKPDAHWALFADVDGTLAELAPTPDGALIPRETLETLAGIRQQLGGAVALVSGRTIQNIDAMCDPFHFAAAGQHGLEMRYEEEGMTDSPESEVIRYVEDAVASLHRKYPRLLIEYKGLSVAVHYRQVPGLEEVVKSFLQRLETVYDHELCLQEGKMVCELRLRHASKGQAIRQFLRMPHFAGRTPVFVGDDITDEDGFKAVNHLGGISIKIGSGTSVAAYRIPTVGLLRVWLEHAQTVLSQIKLEDA